MGFIDAVIEYCKSNPALTAVLIGSMLLMLCALAAILFLYVKGKRTTVPHDEKIKETDDSAEPKATETSMAATDERILGTRETGFETGGGPVPQTESGKTTKKRKNDPLDQPIDGLMEPIDEATSKEIKIETTSPTPPSETKRKPTPRTQKVKSEPQTKNTNIKNAEVGKSAVAKKNTKKKKISNKEGTMLLDELKDIENEIDFYEEDETDRVARYSGKWVICRVVTDDKAAPDEEMYFFELHASNGEKLLSSEEYTSYNGALRGIETHKANILRGNFKITLSKKGDYIFKLLSGKNLLLCMGENYPTRARCESAIESAKRFAKTAIVDENIQDYIIKVPVEDDGDITPLPDGYNGKWIIACREGVDGEQLFYFELFANNGEKLLSSEEYTTYIGAVNGIQTHKTNIKEGNFRVSLTKRGDYIYKLLNKNGQLLCLGEHYKTKRRCLNAVESVKRFAEKSPVLADSKIAQQ